MEDSSPTSYSEIVNKFEEALQKEADYFTELIEFVDAVLQDLMDDSESFLQDMIHEEKEECRDSIADALALLENEQELELRNLDI